MSSGLTPTPGYSCPSRHTRADSLPGARLPPQLSVAVPTRHRCSSRASTAVLATTSRQASLPSRDVDSSLSVHTSDQSWMPSDFSCGLAAMGKSCGEQEWVELRNGTILALIRSNEHNKMAALSSDAGHSWFGHRTVQELTEPGALPSSVWNRPTSSSSLLVNDCAACTSVAENDCEIFKNIQAGAWRDLWLELPTAGSSSWAPPPVPLCRPAIGPSAGGHSPSGAAQV